MCWANILSLLAAGGLHNIMKVIWANLTRVRKNWLIRSPTRWWAYLLIIMSWQKINITHLKGGRDGHVLPRQKCLMTLIGDPWAPDSRSFQTLTSRCHGLRVTVNFVYNKSISGEISPNIKITVSHFKCEWWLYSFSIDEVSLFR